MSNLLSSEQLNALEKLLDPENKICTLHGPAGSGKSFITARLFNDLQNKKIQYCGTTHKAVSVLQKKNKDIKNIKTFHSLLGMKMIYKKDKNGSKLMVPSKKSWERNWGDNDILIIDECSMINEENYKLIKEFVEDVGVEKCIFVGDSFQLLPLKSMFMKCLKCREDLMESYGFSKGKHSSSARYLKDETINECSCETIIKSEDISKTFKCGYSIKLNNIYRTKVIVLQKLYNIFREFVMMENTNKLLDNLYYLYKIRYDEFKIFSNQNNFINNYHKNNNMSKIIISCSNKKVSFYNKTIKRLKFPNSKEKYHVGEEFMINDYYPPYYTCEKIIIKKIEIKTETIEFEKMKLENYKYYYMFDDRDVQYIKPYDDKSKKKFNLFMSKIRSKIKKEKLFYLWSKYYQFKNEYNSPIIDGYSITTYKSQGDSWGDIYVDVNDIMLCRKNDIKLLTRELYTAVSRGKENIYFLYNDFCYFADNKINMIDENNKKCNNCKKILKIENFKNKKNKIVRNCINCREYFKKYYNKKHSKQKINTP